MQKRDFGISDKKGLSEVVTTLLFVLLALGAVLLVWFVVRNLISGASKDIGLEEFSANLEVPGNNIYVDGVLKSVSFIVKRGAGEGTINAVQVVLEDASGQSSSAKYVFDGGLNPLDSKAVSVKYTLGDVKKISIAPIITTADGAERMGSVAASASVTAEMKHNLALKFDGVKAEANSDSISVPNSASINIYGENSLTISTWVRVDGLPIASEFEDIVSKFVWGGYGYWLLLGNSGGAQVMFYQSNGAVTGAPTWAAGTSVVMDGKWHNIVAVFDYQNSNAKIYWDGTEKVSGVVPVGYKIADSSASSLWIGGNSANRIFNGAMKDVRIYNKVIDPTTIKDKLYNNGAGDALGAVSDGLVGRWKLDEGTGGDGTVVKDSSGNGNDGVIHGNPTWQ